MSVQNKPDYKIFADGAKPGEVVAFPDVSRGWGVTLDTTGGIPPMEFFNSFGKRIDEWLMYLTQRGIPEWDSSVDYPKSSMVMLGDVFYVSLKQTKNDTPATSQQSWKKFSDFFGIDGKLSKDQNGADIPNKPKFIENLGLPEWLEKQIKIPVGMFGTFPHRATQLPPKWYSTNGDRFSVSSPQGQALKSLPAELKSDWGIAESGGTINVPNIKQPDGRTPFLRPVNGTVRRVGSVESDTLQNITGSFTTWGGYRESGAFAKEERLSSSLASGALVGDYRGSFDASRVARTSDETRPLSIGITLAIYLGV